jgi:mono/diheme cytochrome c family protein
MRRNRVVWLLVLAGVILVLAGAVAAVRRGFSARDQPSALESYVARNARKLVVSSKAGSKKNPFPLSPELMAEARAHFADHCAICHANNGSGNTEIGKNLYPNSPVLLAFGGDSAIDSAIVVLWRFRAHAAQEQSEKRAARIAAVLLFLLAAYVSMASVMTLLRHSEPKTTYLGISILVAAAAIVPWIATEKRKLSAITGSAALRADAAESALCAYLSLVALVGLGVNAIWHSTRADPVAALVIALLILRESWEAMRGKACGCC